MASWQEFELAAPELAARVRERFTAHKHHVMATLKADGSPRLSGTEVQFVDGELQVGMMPGTRRAADLRRDRRVALHGHSIDPNPDDHTDWAGEAKLSGVAHEPSKRDDMDVFVIDITEVVFTGIGTPADHLLIERWTPSGGLQHTHRH
jgi:hypothetical protein